MADNINEELDLPERLILETPLRIGSCLDLNSSQVASFNKVWARAQNEKLLGVPANFAFC